MNRKITTVLFLGLCTFALNACLPDDQVENAIGSEKDRLDAQLSFYAHSFSEYAEASINHVLNSPVWENRSLEQGRINFNSEGFGFRNLGSTEDYVETAYCEIGADEKPYLITWFDQMNADGNLRLKGVSDNSAGSVANKVSQVMAEDQYGFARFGEEPTDIKIEMKSGDVLALSGPCTELSIPRDSTVVVTRLPEEGELKLVEKNIIRSRECPSGQTGTITEKINAVFNPETHIYTVGANVFGNEHAIRSDDALIWTSISAQCFDATRIAEVDLESINVETREGYLGIDEVVEEFIQSDEEETKEKDYDVYDDRTDPTCTETTFFEDDSESDSCPSGQVGSIVRKKQRAVTVSATCTRSYSDWQTLDTENNCREPEPEPDYQRVTVSFFGIVWQPENDGTLTKTVAEIASGTNPDRKTPMEVCRHIADNIGSGNSGLYVYKKGHVLNDYVCSNYVNGNYERFRVSGSLTKIKDSMDPRRRPIFENKGLFD